MNSTLKKTLANCHPERSEGSWFFRMREHRYFVYIMTNCSRHPLYTGVTNSVDQRSAQHKSGFDGSTSYTARYQIDRLVYFEKFRYVLDAIRREISGDWQK